MLRTLLLSLGAFTLVMLGFLMTRYALGKSGEDWGDAGKTGEDWGRMGKGEA
jgi:hypothetical protein